MAKQKGPRLWRRRSAASSSGTSRSPGISRRFRSCRIVARRGAERPHSEGKLIDPICDMSVEPASAAGRYDYDGMTYYFCSIHCQKLFQSDPAKFLAAANARQRMQREAPDVKQPHAYPQELKPEVPGVIYTCPMDPKVRQSGPGPCPKCGMALEPLDIGAALTKTEFTCPMHPEIIRDIPGACPICGMALEARTVN